MNWIEKMIAEKCPNGVERVKLNTLLDYEQPTPYIVKSTEYSVEYETPVLTAGASFCLGYTNETDGKYKANEENPVIIFDDFTTSFHWVEFDFKVKSSAMKMLRPKKNNVSFRYIYFCMCCIDYIPVEHSRQWIGRYSNFEIPLPPFSIQEEIVSVLDKFSELIEKTDEEIALRQKQYEYCREKLLTFEKGEVEWKTINKIGQLVRGNGLQKADFRGKGTGCIHYGQIYTKLGFSLNKTLSFVSDELANKLTKVEPGDLVIACTSENVEDVCKSVVWLGKETVVTGGHACVFKHNENPKYIGYCFLTHDFFQQKKKYAYGAKVIDIKTEKLGQIKLPIPSPSRQQSIVATLDKFEALISKLKEERELRQKQYEYYREKLLTF